MPCNSPNKIFYKGLKPDGKQDIAFTSRFIDYIILKPDGSFDRLTGQPDTSSLRFGERLITDCDLVPCGQCIGCRMDYSRQWASRLMLEKKSFPDDQCYFITLTYDDEHLPRYYTFPERTVNHRDGTTDVLPPYTCYTNFPVSDAVETVPEIIDNDGTYIKTPFRSVSSRDHQLFMKRLRKRFGNGLRFFAALEYGEKSLRPHEHLIVFGLKDLRLGHFDRSKRWISNVPYKQNFEGDALYECYDLTGPTGAWTDSDGHALGMALVSRVTFDTCNYVTRYIVKKRNKIDKTWYNEVCIEPERCFMSRRPGIGKDYFITNFEDVSETDEIVLPDRDGSFTVRSPRYFDTLLDKLDPERLKFVKDRRRFLMDCSDDLRLARSPTLDLEDIYSTRERKLANTIVNKKGETL